MGLLDDAIREHLDLKRRRGANPEEIERAEREALGPVRRLPEEPAEPSLDDDELPYEDEEDEWAVAPDEEESESRHHDLPAEAPPKHETHEPEPSLRRPAKASEPPAAEAPPAPHPAGHLGEETAEYRIEHEAEGEHEGDDMLEETPEFLQDTPDHDRLWFEQRPPRDFDFDG